MGIAHCLCEAGKEAMDTKSPFTISVEDFRKLEQNDSFRIVRAYLSNHENHSYASYTTLFNSMPANKYLDSVNCTRQCLHPASRHSYSIATSYTLSFYLSFKSVRKPPSPPLRRFPINCNPGTRGLQSPPDQW